MLSLLGQQSGLAPALRAALQNQTECCRLPTAKTAENTTACRPRRKRDRPFQLQKSLSLKKL
jgi:hypothetical protein